MHIPREQTQAIIDAHRAAAGAMMMRTDFLVPDCFEQQAGRLAAHTALVYEGQRITWAELERRSAHYGRAALASGLGPGDVGAVMIENRPEFFYAWLGLARIGAIAGLINTSAQGVALAHALRATQAKVLFIGDECMEQLRATEGLPQEGLTILRVIDAATPQTPRHPRAIDLETVDIAGIDVEDFKLLRAAAVPRRGADVSLQHRAAVRWQRADPAPLQRFALLGGCAGLARDGVPVCR